MSMSKRFTKLLALCLLLVTLCACGAPAATTTVPGTTPPTSTTPPEVTTPGVTTTEAPEPEPEPEKISTVTYVLGDGGMLPEGAASSFSSEADFSLPIPKRAGYCFAGYFTSESYDMSTWLSRIPKGTRRDVTVYAKWLPVVSDLDGAGLALTKTLNVTNYDDNELAVNGSTLTWKQGVTAASQMTCGGNLSSALAEQDLFSFVIDLSATDAPLPQSRIRLRKVGSPVNSVVVNLIQIDTDGGVYLYNDASGKEIGRVTKEGCSVRVTVDLRDGTASAYDAFGCVITSCTLQLPAGETSLRSFCSEATSIVWQWLTVLPKKSSEMNVHRTAVVLGNPFVQGKGVLTPVVNTDSAEGFKVVYDPRIPAASQMADELIAALAEQGIVGVVKRTDSVAARQNEILIGNVDRPETEALYELLAESVEQNPGGYSWVYAYRGGKLVILANNIIAYRKALKDISYNYLKDGELAVPSELTVSMTMTQDEYTYEQLVVNPSYEAYMSHPTYDNFYEGYDDPFSALYSDYTELVVTRADSETYRITYRDDRGGSFTADFVQKRWGMWMMGKIVYTEANGTSHTITSSATDYEFVLSCGGKDNLTFRSGNHADYSLKDAWDPDDTALTNDRLLDMTFYDAKSGDSFSLNVGESKTVKGLRIVMHHNVYELEYKQENVLINVEKSYLYTGYDILCDSKLYTAQTVNFKRSYSCMLPIAKRYGNCAMLYLDGGGEVYLKTGLSNTRDETKLGYKASRIELWGENFPEYHMTVELFNPEHQNFASDETEGYNGLRDMLGGATNKVYCSLFSKRGSLQRGSYLHFASRWGFSIQDGFVNPTREPDYVVGQK